MLDAFGFRTEAGVNQVEIYFSVGQRKVASPNAFTVPAPVGDRIRSHIVFPYRIALHGP